MRILSLPSLVISLAMRVRVSRTSADVRSHPLPHGGWLRSRVCTIQLYHLPPHLRTCNHPATPLRLSAMMTGAQSGGTPPQTVRPVDRCSSRIPLIVLPVALPRVRSIVLTMKQLRELALDFVCRVSVGSLLWISLVVPTVKHPLSLLARVAVIFGEIVGARGDAISEVLTIRLKQQQFRYC